MLARSSPLTHPPTPPPRFVSDPAQLLGALRQLVVPFVRAADDAALDRAAGSLPRDPSGRPQNVLVRPLRPRDLAAELDLALPDRGRGRDGLLDAVAKILDLSVNTWDQGFLDKLYSANTPVGP